MLQRKPQGGAGLSQEEEDGVGGANAGIALALHPPSAQRTKGFGGVHSASAGEEVIAVLSPSLGTAQQAGWFITLMYGELLVFHTAFVSCQWPSIAPNQAEETHQVALIADPQLTDRFSYSFTKSGGMIAQLVQFYSDLYMRRNFRLLQRWMMPSHIFILGDLLDSAKWLNDMEYDEEIDRYRRVFRLEHADTVMRTISGNHDVGFRIDNVVKLTERYTSTFGPINDRVTVGQFEFILLSSASLEMKDWDIDSYDQTINFLGGLAEDGTQTYKPRILLSHVPLWRPQTASCGPLRTSSPQIKNCKGFSYKCLLGEDTTRKIINDVRPIFVFSGDDHDQCVVLHSSIEPTGSFMFGGFDAYRWNTSFYGTDSSAHGKGTPYLNEVVTAGVTSPDSSGQLITSSIRKLRTSSTIEQQAYERRVGIPEQTVGTFSFLQGNLQPSFAMLSLGSTSCEDAGRRDEDGASHHPRSECGKHQLAVDVCLLPQQLVIYAVYGVLALLSTCILVIYHLHHHCTSASRSSILPLRSTSRKTRSRFRWLRRLGQEFSLLLILCLALHFSAITLLW